MILTFTDSAGGENIMVFTIAKSAGGGQLFDSHYHCFWPTSWFSLSLILLEDTSAVIMEHCGRSGTDSFACRRKRNCLKKGASEGDSSPR